MHVTLTASTSRGQACSTSSSPPTRMDAAAAGGGREAAASTWCDNPLVLRLTLCLLEPKALVTARAVNTVWREVASDPQVRKAAFVRHWQLLGCHGVPRQGHFYETAALTSFCVKHAVERADSLQMLAVRHGVSVPCLKRLNNIMTDHSLASRSTLWIPVASQEQLTGRLVALHFDPLIKRQLALVVSPQQQQQQHNAGGQQQQGADVLQAQAQQPTAGGAHGSGGSALMIDALQTKLCQMLGRSLLVDESTASFYLEDAGGDIKAAMEAFAQDVAWEGTTAGPIRTVPVQRWISGHRGM